MLSIFIMIAGEHIESRPSRFPTIDKITVKCSFLLSPRRGAACERKLVARAVLDTSFGDRQEAKRMRNEMSVHLRGGSRAAMTWKWVQRAPNTKTRALESAEAGKTKA